VSAHRAVLGYQDRTRVRGDPFTLSDLGFLRRRRVLRVRSREVEITSRVGSWVGWADGGHAEEGRNGLIAIVFGCLVQDESRAGDGVQQGGQGEVDDADAGADPVSQERVLLDALVAAVARTHDAGAMAIAFDEDSAKAGMGGDDDEAAAGAKDSVGFGEYRWQVIEVGGGHDGGDGVDWLVGEGQVVAAGDRCGDACPAGEVDLPRWDVDAGHAPAQADEGGEVWMARAEEPSRAS